MKKKTQHFYYVGNAKFTPPHLHKLLTLFKQTIVLSIFLLVTSSNLKSQVCTCPGLPIVPTSTTWPYGNASNLCITVSGTLTIPTPTALTNCIFMIEPNGIIQVTGTGLFTATNCCFKGITGIWSTIDVELLASLKFVDCWVQDAGAGVTGHQQFAGGAMSSLSFTNTTFFNNLIGIGTPFFVGSAIGTMGFSITNCDFYGIGTLPGNPTAVAGIGVYLNNLKTVNLSSITGLNKFHELHNFGIQLGTVLSATVAKCTFSNIDAQLGAAGIHHHNGSAGPTFMGTLTQVGLGSSVTSPLTFSNCSNGITVMQTGVHITSNRMNISSHGVSVQGSKNIQNRILDNRITANSMYLGGSTIINSGIGINYFWNEPYGANSTISYNNINMTNIGIGGPGDAMWVYNLIPNGNPGLTMQSNYLKLTDGYNGMYNVLNSSAKIMGNVIDINSNPSFSTPQRGIYMVLGGKNNVSCNTLLSNTQTGTNISTSLFSPIGIDIIGATNGRINCNTLGNSHGLPTGLHFDQNCNSSEIKGNKFNYTGFGLICGPNNCTLNPTPQNSMGNQWTTPPPAGYLYARHYNSLSHIQLSQFKFKPSDGIAFNPPAVSVSPSTGWFDYTSTTSALGIATACATECALNPTPPESEEDGGFTIADFEEANGNDTTSLFPLTEQWKSAQKVYQYFDEDIVLRNSDPDYLSYYNIIKNTAIRDFNEIENAINSLENNYDSILDMHYNNYFLLSEQLSALDSLYPGLDSLGDSSAIANWHTQYNDLQNQLSTEIVAAQQRVANNYIAKQVPISSLLLQVETLPELEIFEWNAKTIYKIILTTTALGITHFSTQQQEDIIQIASQCPLAGGKAVYVARGMWYMFDPTLRQFNDAIECENQGYLMRPNVTSTIKNNISVYPNPASNLLTIAMDEKDTKVEIEVTNMLGKLVYSKECIKTINNLQLDISSLATGIYSLSVKSNSGLTHQGKLSILK